MDDRLLRHASRSFGFLLEELSVFATHDYTAGVSSLRTCSGNACGFDTISFHDRTRARRKPKSYVIRDFQMSVSNDCRQLVVFLPRLLTPFLFLRKKKSFFRFKIFRHWWWFSNDPLIEFISKQRCRTPPVAPIPPRTVGLSQTRIPYTGHSRFGYRHSENGP